MSVMASNILKLPITRAACRGLASQAAVPEAEASSEQGKISCTVLPNKILVSSQDMFGGLSRISVAFKAGSRNEVYKNAGCAHIIRSMTGFSTLNFTDFIILRNAQQNGSYITCTGDREVTSFNLIGTRDNIHNLFPFLGSIVSAPAFKPWQVKRNIPRLKYELSLISPKVRTMEMLHKAAFRTGLGNSLFISEDFVGERNSDTLSEFFINNFTANQAVVVGYNLFHKDVVNFAESFTLPTGDPNLSESKYYGGEIRQDKNTNFTTIAMAVQGVGSKDLKQVLTYGVLQNALGAGPTMKWGSSPSPVHRGISALSSESGGACFNISYSDNGLFGIIGSTTGQNAGYLLEEMYKILKSGKVSDADIKRGKALLKMKLLDSMSSSEVLMEDIAHQSLVNCSVVPATVLSDAIDKISESDVQNAAKHVACSKLSLAVYGNTGEVPYLDDLK